MNIFYINEDPKLCAQEHNDKHVVKMILEYAQLLSTAHRMIDGVLVEGLSPSGRKAKRYVLPDKRDESLYVATHANHPSAKWTRHSKDNYNWLFKMWMCLLEEYTHRYGKIHSSTRIAHHLEASPNGISTKEGFSPPWRAMPDDVKIGNDSLASYRNYYITHKYKMSRWTNRDVPSWFTDGIYKLYNDELVTIQDHKKMKFVQLPMYKNANLHV